MDAQLFALVRQSPQSDNFFLLDLMHFRGLPFSNLASEQEYLKNYLLIFVDAKRDLKSLGWAPSPYLRLICLSTIKKLIKKNIHESIADDFLDEQQALSWCKNALASALKQIEKLDMSALCDLECRVINATLAMEITGLPFDKMAWQEHLHKFAVTREKIEKKLLEMLPSDGFMLFGPKTIDLNNHHQVKEALEKLLGHNLKGTSQSYLKDVDHEAARLVIEYREFSRLNSAYGETFLSKITDRLRGEYVILGSASGRFSCHEPNLLALPNHELFQACIKPEKGFSIVHFDYSACEIRILAALSQDEALLNIFLNKQDIHSMVASKVFHKEVCKDKNTHLRDQAKVLNFGLIYGMGEHALSQQLKISLEQAQDLFKQYFKQFRSVQEYLLGLEQHGKKHGFVMTALNRRGYLDVKNFNPRVARNVPIQGTGADIIKLAMCRVYQKLDEQKLDAKIINVIHDEIVVETNDYHKDEVVRLVTHEMEQAFLAILPNVPAEVSVS